MRVRAARAVLFAAAGLALIPLEANAQAVPAPAGVPPPPLRLNGALQLSEGYTSNAGGLNGTNTGKPDTFTRGLVGFGLHFAGARLNADAHYTLTGEYYSRFHRLDQLQNRLNLTAAAQIVPDHLFLNVRAFATPTALTRVGAISANDSSVSNINNRNTYGYVAQPELLFHVGDYAISQTSLSEGGVFFERPSTANSGTPLPFIPVRNTTSTTVTEKLSSGSYFGRLYWDLTGSYNETRQTTQSERQSQGAVDLAFALSRTVSLMATGGYTHFTASVPLTRNLSGPTALTGARFTFGPTFDLFAEAGIRNRFPTYLGSLHWDVTATFRIEGTLSDTVGTPQGNILTNLSSLGANVEGAFSDAQSDYGQTLDQALLPQFATTSPLSANGLALSNSINHERRAQMAFLHQGERTDVGLSLFYDTRNRLSITTDTTPPKSWIYGARLNLTRRMRTDLTGHAGLSYSLANEFGGHDRIFTADAGLSYKLDENLNATVTGRYLKRDSSGQTVSNVPLNEIVTIAGIRWTF